MYNMDLFAELAPAPINIIEHDGIVEYYGMMLSYQQADDYFEKLLTQIQWKHDQANIQGQFIVTARKVAWYGDQPFIIHTLIPLKLHYLGQLNYYN